MTLNLFTSISMSNKVFTANEYLPVFPAKKNERILIVDDEQIIRHFLIDCLSARYECVEAASVEEAFEILAEESFSLIVTDWVMTGKSGTTLLRYVVGEFPDTPVIMLTGVNNPERALDAMRFGAFDYLLKPCKPDILEFTVERALRHRELETKNRQYKIDLELQNIELTRQKDKLEKLQAQMIHTEKMSSLGQLSAGIAHEINNPLGCVSGNLQLLEEHSENINALLDFYENARISEKQSVEALQIKEKINYDESRKNAAQMISDCLDGTRRITEIVENLRVFSKLDAPEFTPSNLNRDLSATIKFLDYFFEKQNIKLVLNYGDIPPVEVFAGHLNQVWMNILMNAAQSFEKNGGEISVTTGTSGDFVFVEIADTGRGIAS